MTKPDKYGWRIKKTPMIDTSSPDTRQRKKKEASVIQQAKEAQERELKRLERRNLVRQWRLEKPKENTKVFPGQPLEKRLFHP